MFCSLNRILSSFKGQWLFYSYTHHFEMTISLVVLSGRLQTSKEGYADSPTPSNQATPSRITLLPAHSLEAAYSSTEQRFQEHWLAWLSNHSGMCISAEKLV